jgi:hypothetical protein
MEVFFEIIQIDFYLGRKRKPFCARMFWNGYSFISLRQSLVVKSTNDVTSIFEKE